MQKQLSKKCGNESGNLKLKLRVKPDKVVIFLWLFNSLAFWIFIAFEVENPWQSTQSIRNRLLIGLMP